MKRQNIYLFSMVIFVAMAMAPGVSGAERRNPASNVRSIVGGGAGWADVNGAIHFEDDAQVGTFRSIFLCLQQLFRREAFAPKMAHERRMAMLGLDQESAN